MKPLIVVVALAGVPFSSCGWIDPDTPLSSRETESYFDGRPYHLVYSDEFEEDGRTFKDGEDPRWTAMNKDDYTNFALHYYKDDLVRTSNGVLNITTILEDIEFTVEDPKSKDNSHSKRITKNFQSGMVQGWNKFCFTGGVVEIKAKLPGLYDVGGLWPAMWLLGE